MVGWVVGRLASRLKALEGDGMDEVVRVVVWRGGGSQEQELMRAAPVWGISGEWMALRSGSGSV